MNFQEQLVVVGTDTNVGKTIVSSILVREMHASYWKPIQCGGLETGGDSEMIKNITRIQADKIITEAYRFRMPASPNQAAAAENIIINRENLKMPKVEGALIIEMAGGLMVPLTDNWLQIDQIKEWKLPVVLVARSGLGTLNHTLLSIEALDKRLIPIKCIILNGAKHELNEATLQQYWKGNYFRLVKDRDICNLKLDEISKYD
jgi:dethiobiotin synthetase